MLPGGSRNNLHDLGHIPGLDMYNTGPAQHNGRLGSTVADLSADDISVHDLSVGGLSYAWTLICPRSMSLFLAASGHNPNPCSVQLLICCRVGPS